MAPQPESTETDETTPDDSPVSGIVGFLDSRVAARQLLLVSDSPRVVGEVVNGADLPIVLATTKEDISSDYADDCETVLQLSVKLPGTLEMLEDLRGIVISAYLEGSLGDGEDVVCLVANDEQPTLMVNFSISSDPMFRLLKARIEERCDLSVFEMLLQIAGDLVRKGREGHKVGTMFIVGDHESVLEASRQVLLNPFQGHTREERRVLNPENSETIKEYAMLDGAMVVSGDGYLEAAGRYIMLEPDAEAASGLGGRHLAAASITKETEAVAIVVSSSGVVRVYKDGSQELELDGF
jgi:DNA integrity scanning protein DisA with diadenylate cyclase activity